MHSEHKTPDILTLMTRGLLTVVVWLFAMALLAGCSQADPLASDQSDSVAVVSEAAASVAKESVATPKVAKMPTTFNSVKEKKRAFFAFLKPYVVAENGRVRALRVALTEKRQAGSLDAESLRWLSGIADQYKVKLAGEPDQAFWSELLKRVDVVPVEMALVQAANESAWGQSRFAREGNNFFGQWCYSKGCGMVPSARNAGSTHEVRRFSSPAQSVRAYIQNINRTRAYRELRRIRLTQRKQNQPLDAEQLALGLKSYSERGMAYVKTIQSMIRSNRRLIRNS